MKIIFDTITEMVGPDGILISKITGVSVVHIVPQNKKNNWEIIPKKKYLAHVIKRSVPAGLSYEIIKDDEIPNDRTFRAAWEKKSKAIKVNIEKAGAIHLDRIRQAREPVLLKSDTDFVRALEDGQDMEPIKKKRQVLRDIPQNIDLGAAKTPDELKLIWPKELPKF